MLVMFPLWLYFRVDFTSFFITFKTQQGGTSALVHHRGFNLMCEAMQRSLSYFSVPENTNRELK